MYNRKEVGRWVWIDTYVDIKILPRTLNDVQDHFWDEVVDDDDQPKYLDKWDKMAEVGMYPKDFI